MRLLPGWWVAPAEPRLLSQIPWALKVIMMTCLLGASVAVGRQARSWHGFLMAAALQLLAAAASVCHHLSGSSSSSSSMGRCRL
jgi:hypothetical protein